MHQIDRAISHLSDDQLGRRAFAKRMAEYINNYKDIESYSLGITGQWGSGKTSIINMLKESLDSKILVYNFTPWDISVRKQLIGDFFSGMSLLLDSEEGKKVIKAEELSKQLKLYSSLFKPLKYIPVLAPIIEAFGEILNITSETLNLYAEGKENDLLGIKRELNKLLEESGKKILIIIDDIDRLSDVEIKDIFHLVKSVGDLKNTFYILSYDKELVTNVLNKVQQDRGQEYAEKLINIEIKVPQIKKEDVDSLFKKEIFDLFPEINGNHYHYTTVNLLFDVILTESFSNLREVKRFINILSFSSTFAKKLNIIDFIIITYLREYRPDIYTKIKDINYKLEKENKLLVLLYRKKDIKFTGREFTNPDYRFQYFSLDIEEFPEELLGNKDLKTLLEILSTDKEKGKRYLKKILSSFTELEHKKLLLFFEVVLNSVGIAGNSDPIINQSDIYKQIIVFLQAIDNKSEIVRVLNDIELNENYNYSEFFRFLNDLKFNHSLEVEAVIKKHIKAVLSKREINKNLISSFDELNRFKKDLVKNFLNNCFKEDIKIFDYLECMKDEINHEQQRNIIYENGEPIGEDEPDITWDDIIFYEDIDSHYGYDSLVSLVNNINRELNDDEKHLKGLLLKKSSKGYPEDEKERGYNSY